jgi:hypothetical protein
VSRMLKSDGNTPVSRSDLMMIFLLILNDSHLNRLY